MNLDNRAVHNTEGGGMTYDWDAIGAAADRHGIDPDTLKDWVFEGVTDEGTADQIALAYLSEQRARE